MSDLLKYLPTRTHFVVTLMDSFLYCLQSPVGSATTRIQTVHFTVTPSPFTVLDGESIRITKSRFLTQLVCHYASSRFLFMLNSLCSTPCAQLVLSWLIFRVHLKNGSESYVSFPISLQTLRAVKDITTWMNIDNLVFTLRCVL